MLRDPLPNHERVAVLGLGASGKAACRLLDRFNKSVIASDSRASANTDELPADVETVLGAHPIEDATAVVLSPGLNPAWPENRDNPMLRPVLEAAERGDIELVAEIDLAMRAYQGQIITVGGTDGKSTTAALVHHILNALGLPAALGGNSWKALADVLCDDDDCPAVVAEVSAFQSMPGHAMRPDVAILTNIADDHLDHYASFDDYVDAKGLIATNLSRDGALLYWEGDEHLSGLAARHEERGGRSVPYDTPRVANNALSVNGFDGPISTAEWRLPGAHNLRNLEAALKAISLIPEPPELSPRTVASALATFSGLPHRIEFVRELEGSRYFNDSKATNVHAAVVGIRSMTRPTVAIVGGVDKNLPLDDLLPALREHASHIIAIGELAPRLVSEASEAALLVETADSLEAATARARSLATPGHDVLLAPASSSFDMFRSFEHRGDVFRQLVEAL